jgi:hypothetical protein
MRLVINKAATPRTALIRAVDNNNPVSLRALVLADKLPLTIYLADGEGDYAPESGNVTTWSVEVGIGVEGSSPPDAYTAGFTQTADTKGWTGTLDLATAELAARLGAANEVTLTFEVQLTGPGGERRTVLQAPVVIRAQVINGTSFPGASLPEAVLRPGGTPLVNGRVPYADINSQLVDSANFLRRGSGDQLLIGPNTFATATVPLDVGVASGDIIGRFSAPNADGAATMAVRSTASNVQVAVSQRGLSVAGTMMGLSAGGLCSLHSFSAGATAMLLGMQAAAPIVFAAAGVERARVLPSGGMRIAPSAAPASPANGDIWADSTGGELQTRQGGMTQIVTGRIFTQTASVALTNSTTETSLLGTGSGSKNLSANFLTVGKTIRISALGSWGYASGSVTLRLKRSSTVLATLSWTPGGGTSGIVSVLDALLTCRSTGASGTVSYFFRHSSGGFVHGATVTLDTTLAGDIDVTAQFGTAHASNRFDHYVGTVEVL